MMHADEVRVDRRGRKRRPIAEKLSIVQLTRGSGASVAEIARSHGVNANQVFKWRRMFERGQLNEAVTESNRIGPGFKVCLPSQQPGTSRAPAGGFCREMGSALPLDQRSVEA
jgi:transposase-like protein